MEEDLKELLTYPRLSAWLHLQGFSVVRLEYHCVLRLHTRELGRPVADIYEFDSKAERDNFIAEEEGPLHKAVYLHLSGAGGHIVWALEPRVNAAFAEIPTADHRFFGVKTKTKSTIRNAKKRARKKRAREARVLANECPVCFSREADTILHGDERHKICGSCSKVLAGGLCPLCRHQL
jgi:hypothetical protein